MTDLPRYQVGRAEVDDAIVVDDIDAFPEPDREPGWVFIGEADPASILALVRRLGEAYGPWSPILVSDRWLPIGPGWPQRPDDAEERIRQGESQAGFLSFRVAMEDLARVRHDINNPLTAALAEVQLTLLDVEPDTESEESLKVVESQLRRIRDLVQELKHYRIPKP